MKKLCISMLALITLLTISTFADGWYLDGANWKYEDKDGNFITDSLKKSNGDTYYLDDKGNMATDFLLNHDDDIYYFATNGIMVKNTWVALDPSMIEDQPYEANAYFMYFGNNGKAIKGEGGKKRTIDGKTYIFDENGIMLVGWLNENGEILGLDDEDEWYSEDAVYYAKEDGSLADGWMLWTDGLREEMLTDILDEPLDDTQMWFYFDPKTNKKKNGKKEQINGREYYFQKNTGRMLPEWEYLDRSYYDLKYVRLPYIESDGTNYIDTGYVDDVSSEIVIKFSQLDTGEGVGSRDFFGVSDYSNPSPAGYGWANMITLNPKEECGGLGAFHDSFLINLRRPIEQQSRNVFAHETYVGKDLKIIMVKEGYAVTDADGNLVSVYTDGGGAQPAKGAFATFESGTSTCTDYIFEINGGTFGPAYKTRLYQLVIKKNGKTVRDYVPAKLIDDVTNAFGETSHEGELGLWDRKNGKFYPKKEGNDFITDESASIPDYANLPYSGDYNMYQHPEYNKYYQDENNGSLYNEGWFYQVPSWVISSSDYEENKKQWFYAESNGRLVIDKEKKINGKTYLFDKNGVMQTGLIMKYSDGNVIEGYATNYVIENIDLQETSGEDFIKKGICYMEKDPIGLYPEENTNIDAITETSSGTLFKENCIKMRYNTGNFAYNIFNYGDDGVKKTGKDIKVNFSDGEYLFSSDEKGALYGFNNDKYYTNGFLCKADDEIGYGILIDYGAINSAADSATKIRSIKPYMCNYNNAICERGHMSEEVVGAAIVETAPELTKYYAHYSLLSLLSKGLSNFYISGLTFKNHNCVFVVDKNGKRKNKGVYKDGYDGYWLVDKNKELVGVFTVPVKWGKVDGKEVPMYKSTFVETRSNGEQEEKEKFMPFFTRDVSGNTEIDYVQDIDDSYMANAVIGNYDFGWTS